MGMRNLTSHFSTKSTPQTEPVPVPGRESEMKENSAGGFSFTVDKWITMPHNDPHEEDTDPSPLGP